MRSKRQAFVGALSPTHGTSPKANLWGRPTAAGKSCRCKLNGICAPRTKTFESFKSGSIAGSGRLIKQVFLCNCIDNGVNSGIFRSKFSLFFLMTFNGCVARSIPAGASCASVEFCSIFIAADSACAIITVWYIFQYFADHSDVRAIRKLRAALRQKSLQSCNARNAWKVWRVCSMQKHLFTERATAHCHRPICAYDMLVTCLYTVVREMPKRRDTRLMLPPVSSHVFLINRQLSLRMGDCVHVSHGVTSLPDRV